MEVNASLRRVGILGSGCFSRAIAKRLLLSRYDVYIGSRQPEQRMLPSKDEILCKVKLVSIKECISAASTIFVAIHAENYEALLTDHVGNLTEKILIDVSNRKSRSRADSNAEYLQRLVPNAKIVKAFNVLSAYTMENDYDTSSRQVFLAGNDEMAKSEVANIVRDINFIPVDYGDVRASRMIEAYPLRLFPEWKGPIVFTCLVAVVWFALLIYLQIVVRKKFAWEQIFLKGANKAIGMTAITVLAFTYMPSSFAALFQIYYGTKHLRFPKWLDAWLKTRKQLGLFAFILTICHTLMSCLVLSPTYLKSWYQSTDIVISLPQNQSIPIVIKATSWMSLRGEAVCIAGVLSFVVLCIIAVTTLPSVTNAMNWREWRFVQSKLGHVALVLAVVHVFLMGIEKWLGNPNIFKFMTFLSSVVPWITLLLKVGLSLPCVDIYVNRIRSGWERNAYMGNKISLDAGDSFVMGIDARSEEASSIGHETMKTKEEA